MKNTVKEEIINSVFGENSAKLDSDAPDCRYFNYRKTGIYIVIEEDKCDELIWVDINNLPKPFINYEGVFLEDKTITTYDCKNDGAYVKS